MKPSEKNPMCQDCGLWQGCASPFMKASQTADEPSILIVGEAPGVEEDKDGKPFVGDSGKLLRQVLDAAGIDINDVAFTNVVRCRPPDNKITKKAILACRQFAVEDIQYYEPKVVMLMGNTPLSAILGENGGITNWNGVVMMRDNIKYVPLFHPAYILRDNTKMDEWLAAISVALDDTVTEDPWEFVYPKTVVGTRDMLLELRAHEYISFDTETTSLDAFSKGSAILSVSFGIEGKSWAVPIDHPEATWSDEEYDIVVNDCIDILKTHKVIGHHTKFDMMFVKAMWNVDIPIAGDTMLESHLIDSRPGIHGLKHQAAVRLDMYDYEKPLDDYVNAHPEANAKKGGSYAFVPLKLLLKYNALDTKATWLLDSVLYSELSDKQKILYDEIQMPTSDMLCRIQSNGLRVDQYIATRYANIYAMIKAEEYGSILKDPKVKKLIKKRVEALSDGKPTKKHFTFNPNSSYQLSELFFDYYKLPVLAKSKLTQKPSTSGKLYRTYEEGFPILAHIRMFKLLGKMLSTYLLPATTTAWLSDDGGVHTTFNQHGSRTGRLSASDPVNLQNIPTPEKEPGTILETLPVKNIFTHRDWIDQFGNDVYPGELYDDDYDAGALVTADYSGMELRCFASLAKCMLMIAIHKSGLDFHKMVAALSMHMLTQDDVMHAAEHPLDIVPILDKIDKAVRYRYKWTNWTLLYGGDAYTLHRLYNVPLEDAEETIKIYYDTFPEVLSYREETTRFVEDHGYIESPYGRRELLPHINSSDAKLRNKAIREAVNMPVQSGASETLNIAGVLVDKKLIELGMNSLLVNTVHDSLAGDCPRGEIIKFAELCKNCMENVTTLVVPYMPHVDFSWLISPLVADVDVGTHYGSEIPLDEWKGKYGHVN
jgi:DNA polymerase-1